MEIRHHVSLNQQGIEDIIKRLGIRNYLTSIMSPTNTIVHFDINESHPAWEKVHNLILLEQGVDLVDTFFTREEILAAEYSLLRVSHLRGYPQPETGWEDLTYEDECLKCQGGYKQKAPFRIKDPQMGKKDFMSLFWGYAFFCTPRVVEEITFNGLKGLEVWPAIVHRTNQPSTTVSQLVFPQIMKPGYVDADNAEYRKCPECRLVRYALHLRGYMKIYRNAIIPGLDAQTTYEWFAPLGMYNGRREVIISNKFAKIILDNYWKGVELKPIKLF